MLLVRRGQTSMPCRVLPSCRGGTGLRTPRGLDMILDIPLDVTVELGRVRMLIKDVLELPPARSSSWTG